MNEKVDAFIETAGQWREEFRTLRKIMLGCGLEEELKWGVPSYASEGKIIALIHGFKQYCAILFMNGSLLADEKKLLVRQTDNVQTSRQIRFTAGAEIESMAATIAAYIAESVALAQSGAKPELKTTKDFSMPEEFRNRIDGDVALRKAFEALTPGRQRAYLLYFSGAKQAKTREQRIENCAPAILAGKGLHD